jgi:hypothetical protein
VASAGAFQTLLTLRSFDEVKPDCRGEPFATTENVSINPIFKAKGKFRANLDRIYMMDRMKKRE